MHPGQEEPNESALEWLFTNQKFVRWIYRSGSRFLHLVQAASETKSPSSLLRLLKDVGSQSIRESHIFYFQFRKHDARFNCIRGLLTTFIAQATATMVPNITLDESASQMLENVGFMKPLPDHDLFYLVACVCRAIRTRNGQVYWIIWNLDACSDSLSRLVKSLADLDTFSEFPCRILFESSGAQGVIESMNDLEVVTVKNEGASPTPNNKHVSSPELEKLTKDCPALSPFSDSLNKVLSHHRQNNIVDTVIAQWTFNFTTALAACSSPKTINEALERLSNMTAQQFFMNIIASIPPHKFPWAKRVLAWVKNSCRPLTIWELDNAMGFNKTAPRHADHWRTTDFAFDLQDCFLGLLIVENNEVSFIHPTVREYLSHPECASQNWHMADRDAHLDMLQSLLRCLCREDDRVLSPPAPVKRGYLSHPVPSRLDLRSYAAEYWLQHYREAKHRAQKPSEYEGDIKVFLGNPAAVRSWASIMGLEQPLEAPEGHNSGGAPFSQLAVVTLAARVGLGTAEFDFLCPGWQSHPELVLAALLEGVSNGHISLVKQLEMPPLDEKSLDELIDMASSCGDAEVFRILFSKIRGRSKFPPQFLKRAARLGVEQVIKQVIGDGNSGEDAGEESLFNYISDLIIEAIRFRQTEITKFLVKRLAPQNPTFDMLKTACQVGNSCDLEQLLEDGFNTAALRKSGRWDRSDFKDLLETACTCGNPAVVEVLIRDSNADEMGNLWPCLELAVSNGLPECTAKLLTLIELSSESPSSVRDHLWDVLMAGVGEGQVDTCRLLLDKGVDPNYKKSHNNDAALCHAFKKGKIPMIALLLDRGMDIEGTDDYDATALWEAANRGLTEIVTYLLDRGADVNTRAGYGGTALYQACLKNHKAIVEILLQKGANVRLSTHRKNWSPLEASFDFPDILELLVEKSPDFRRVAGGTTALWRAARGGFEKSAELLLRGDPNIEFIPMDYSEEEDGLTPLAMAVKGGHAKVARLLLEAGANINYVTPKGDFILKFVQNGETLAVLLEYNPDLKLVDEEGNAAIHVLVSQSTEDLAAIKRLVNAGADIQAFNKVGETPLTIAVAGGDMELITYLVSKAAGIDTSKAYSGGALHQACNVASLKIVKFLVDNGANVDLPHTAVGTPLSCVCTSEKEQFDKITYLVEERHAKIGVKGGWHGHALNEACLRCDVNTVRYLVNQGGKTFLSQPDHLGRVPVFYACYKREDAVNMVRYLISQGVDVSAKVKDKMGRTVLHCAVVAHNPDLVRLLIEHDKELVHAADDDGWTPLHWATRRAYGPVSNSGMWYTRPSTGEKLSDMVRLLLKDGSGDLVLTGKAANQRWSPLKLARYHGVYESLKDQLTPESLKEEQPAENPELYESKAAVFHRRLCDACFCVCSLLNVIPKQRHALTRVLRAGITRGVLSMHQRVMF